jgi:hypothetical protein
MIVIFAPTAQLASDTLNLNNPPTLTVGAEYGAFVLEGTRYTSAYNQPSGSPYSSRHISPFGKPASCLDKDIPQIKDTDVALISHLDLNTLGGLMRATNKFIENESFWSYVEWVERNRGKTKKGHPCWATYNEVQTWVEKNQSYLPTTHNTDVTKFCYDAFDVIREVLEGGLAHAHIKLKGVQEVKERACLLALQLGFALIRRDDEIHALYPCGKTKCISESLDINDVWFDALRNLLKTKENK